MLMIEKSLAVNGRLIGTEIRGDGIMFYGDFTLN
jgi:hypothetical protein